MRQNEQHTHTDIPCVLILIVDEREREKESEEREAGILVLLGKLLIVLWTHVTNGRSAIAEQKEEYDA